MTYVPDRVTRQVTRTLPFTCGHQHRVRLAVPSDLQRNQDLDAFLRWREGAFAAKAEGECPTCEAADLDAGLCEAEAQYGAHGIHLRAFASEKVTVAAFARTVRLGYLDTARSEIMNPSYGQTSLALLVASSLMDAKPSSFPAAQALGQRMHLRRVGSAVAQFDARYWITKKRTAKRLGRLAGQDPHQVVAAMLTAGCEWGSEEDAYQVFVHLLRPVTDTDRDLLTSGREAATGHGDILRRASFLRALAQ